MENLARREDEAQAPAVDKPAGDVQPANAVLAPPADDERPRIDWLKAIAVIVITVATVLIAIKAFTYREEIGEWVRQTIAPDVQVPMSVAPTYGSDGESTRGITRLEVAGRPTVHGEALQNGVVRLTVEDANSQQYLGGEVIEVKGGDSFETTLGLASDARGFRSSAITVRAAVSGVHRGKSVAGESEINIGFPRAYSGTAGWIAAGVLALVAIGMMWLFTGNIHARKQRWLYATMYFLVFASLAVPLAASVLVAQSTYLVSTMEKAPIGLVRATSAATREPEWLLNLGGVVSRGADGNARVAGGLAVPFYVVLLAMAGAGINLVRRVPEIQEEHRGSVQLSSPFPKWLHRSTVEDPLGDDEQRRRTSAFRRALVQNFVYLMAAPFLAMAVYYLLQAISSEPGRAVVVVAAFLSGLLADSVVGGIFRLAEQGLKSSPADEAESARAVANARIAQINARVREEQAKLAESIFLAQAARAREDIIAARADHSNAMPEVPTFEPVAPVSHEGAP